jgi:uncharacterized protein YhfF/catechol 2,3-dioxygenase-like lactoylglutathione lyase family enzyme
MIHHLTLGTDDLARGGAFFDAVLAPLGLVRSWDDREGDGWLCWQPPGSEALGPDSQPGFWLCRPADGGAASAGNGATVAFTAPTRAAVRAFHKAALANGGSCEGPPGLRPHYGERYYGTYVRDPAGNKIAAVCRRPDVWWQDLEVCQFGSTPAIQTQLAHLVAIGVKQATAGAYNGVATESTLGQQWLVVDGHARPVCVIETTAIDLLTFDQISAGFAAREGEGDGNLAYWRAVHEDWFRSRGEWSDGFLIEAEQFRLVEVIDPDTIPPRDEILAREAASVREWLPATP